MFENPPKCRIKLCERTFGQTVLQYWSLLIGKKLLENAKVQKIKCDNLGDFQTLCTYVNSDTLMMVKNGDFGVVCRNVSVKLLLVEVPLDAVEVIAFEIVVTFENGLVPFQSMRRDHGVRQKLHTDTTCKSRMKKKSHSNFYYELQ